MIFAHTMEGVLDGSKTVTRRLWKPEYKWCPKDVAIGAESTSGGSTREIWRVGMTYAAQPGRGLPAGCRIRITKLSKEPLITITAEDALREGVRFRRTPSGGLLVALAPSPCAADYLPDGPFDQMNGGKGPSAEQLLIAEYFALWDSINKARGTRVKDDPTVVRIEFEKVESDSEKVEEEK